MDAGPISLLTAGARRETIAPGPRFFWRIVDAESPGAPERGAARVTLGADAERLGSIGCLSGEAAARCRHRPGKWSGH